VTNGSIYNAAAVVVVYAIRPSITLHAFKHTGHSYHHRWWTKLRLPVSRPGYDHGYRRSQRGYSRCTCTPRAVKKIIFRPNLQEKCVSAPPGHEVHPTQPEQESIFRTVFAGWLRFGGIFTRSLRAMTKKGRQLFFGKKCTPRQNAGYAYDQTKEKKQRNRMNL